MGWDQIKNTTGVAKQACYVDADIKAAIVMIQSPGARGCQLALNAAVLKGKNNG